MRAFSQGPYSKSSLTAGSSLHNDVSLLKKKKKGGGGGGGVANGQYFKAHILICP